MRAGGAAGKAALAGLAALTLAAGAAGAVTLLDEPAPPPAAPVRAPLPAPAPPPSRPPLLEPVAGGGNGAAPTAAGLAGVVDAALADPALGGRLAVSVADVAARQVLLERGADQLLIPASTAKIVTAVAALTAVDPLRTLPTRVLAGAEPGEVVLVGGGDTTLASGEQAQVTPRDARLDLLAAQVVAGRGGVPVTRVVVDDTLYTGPATGPGWRPGYVAGGHVAPVSALMVDGGRVRPDRSARVADPALAAGAAFAGMVQPTGPTPEIVRGTAPDGAAQLAVVESPPLRSLVERMLDTSDNDLAEALARQVALAEGQPASFAGVARALTTASARVLERAGVPGAAVQLVDGSGLSRENALAPGALTRLLASVGTADPGRLAPVLTGLPVGGFSGTLSDRYRAGPQAAGAGVVRAKTGTLMGVSALAGVVLTADGRLLAFALTADRVAPGRTLAAEAALDRVAAGFAACGC